MHAPPDLDRLLRDRFRLPAFRPGQRALIEAVLAGRDALGVLPTGGGKSLCYQVPAAARGGLSVVVTPLLSLIDDQVGRARALGFRAEGLGSTRAPGRNRAALEAAARGELDLLFLAPERLEQEPVRRLLRAGTVSLAVVDEAHCISLWGNDFRPSYRRLGEALARPRTFPVLALTATATPAVRLDVARVLDLRAPEQVVLSFDRPNLSWTVVRCAGPGVKRDVLLPALRRALAEAPWSSAIVYAGTRRAVRAVHAELARGGLEARPYHAGLDAPLRLEAQRWFLEARHPVLVATNAFGMGIDRPDVRLVAHHSVPASLEAYYQEAGRAGRDGRPARVLALDAPADRDLRRGLLDSSRPPPDRLAELHEVLLRVFGPGRPVRPDRLRTGLAPAWAGQAGPAALRGLEAAGGLSVREDGFLSIHEGPLDLGPVRALRRQGVDGLAAAERFLRTRGCRRRVLLGWFGESAPSRCEACDRCARTAVWCRTLDRTGG